MKATTEASRKILIEPTKIVDHVGDGRVGVSTSTVQGSA